MTSNIDIVYGFNKVLYIIKYYVDNKGVNEFDRTMTHMTPWREFNNTNYKNKGYYIIFCYYGINRIVSTV